MGGAIPAGQTRVERGFIGAHADIGGGFGQDDSQLAQVALAWMVNQAKAAGVTMNDDPRLHTIIANPVIHDKSDAIRFGSPVSGSAISGDRDFKRKEDYQIPSSAAAGTGAEDREVRYLDRAKTTQRKMTGTGMTFTDTEKFIAYTPRPDMPKNLLGFTTDQTGTVDMQAYLDWLNANGYGLTNLTVQ